MPTRQGIVGLWPKSSENPGGFLAMLADPEFRNSTRKSDEALGMFSVDPKTHEVFPLPSRQGLVGLWPRMSGKPGGFRHELGSWGMLPVDPKSHKNGGFIPEVAESCRAGVF